LPINKTGQEVIYHPSEDSRLSKIATSLICSTDYPLFLLQNKNTLIFHFLSEPLPCFLFDHGNFHPNYMHSI
jgi:hypothetical protein